MSNTLTTVRGSLAAVLDGAGLPTVDHLPERPNPPIAIISPGQPYLTRGDTFGSFAIQLTVVLLTRTATNEVATEALDEMTTRLAVAVAESKFTLTAVDQPQSFQVNTANYLGVTVDIALTTCLEVTP